MTTFTKESDFEAALIKEPINRWQDVAASLLFIPMAHQLIGFYTVADEADGVLKVLRSYQYYAARAISDKVAKTDWENPNRLGGYIWHTTGSGKTLTSFKSAQLIAGSQDADKVVFVLDRIELGTQTLAAYKNFVGDSGSVQATEDTGVLVSKLKSNAPADTLIVTSIQKLSRLKDEPDGPNASGLAQIRRKRIVFIVDECHRSTFGDMLYDIKRSFEGAIFFGFTGTPIHDENRRKNSTTSDVFGDELHRYSIADGVRDKNVLGFDPYQVATFRDSDIRRAVALQEAKAKDVAEAMSDEKKKEVFNRFMRDVPMVSRRGDGADDKRKGIEDYLPTAQYNDPEHRATVVQDIADNWQIQIRNVVDYLGVDEQLLTDFINSRVTDANINEYGRFDRLKASVDRQKAQDYFAVRESAPLQPYQVSIKTDRLLRKVVLTGEFEEEPQEKTSC